MKPYLAFRSHFVAAILLILCFATATPASPSPDLEVDMDDACQTGTLIQVQKLVKLGAHVGDTREYHPLCRAAWNPNGSGIIRYLVSHGAGVNKTDGIATPLMRAAQYSRVSNMQTLLALGAKVDQTNEEGQTALFWTSFSTATRNRWEKSAAVSATRFLIAHGARVNVIDKDGDTPLMEAVREGSLDCIKVLLAHKANVAVRNADGKSAYDLALTLSGDNTVEIVGLLLEGK